MKTWVHLVVSAILAAALYPVSQWKVLLIFAGGVLIDIDHYLWYICKYKKFNLIDSYKFYLKNMEIKDFTNVYGILLVFHTIEFLFIMVFLSFYNEFALLFTLGLLAHYILDIIFILFVSKRFIVNHSLILWLVKNTTQKT